MAPRVRVAASACLVASGLFIAGAGGAIALADPGHGNGRSDGHSDGPSDDRTGSQERSGDDSIGDLVRRAFGLGGDGQNSSNPWQRPDPRLGNGRGLGETEPPGAGESPTKDTTTKETTTKETTTKETTTKPSTPCPTTDPTEPGEPPGEPGPTFPESGGGGGGGIEQLPRYKPPQVPDMQLPNQLQPSPPGLPGAPGVLEAGAGVAAAAAPAGPALPIALPVIVAPPLGLGITGGAGAGPRGGPSPDVKSIFAQPPAGRTPPPANVGSNAAAPNASYRIGYTEYLRTAGLPQVAALAVPGLVGILVLTGAGGFVGYRQAKAGHAVHVGGSARFMR